jgi:hypothetical protein
VRNDAIRKPSLILGDGDVAHWIGRFGRRRRLPGGGREQRNRSERQ